MNPNISLERIEQLRAQFGQNTPLLQQYWHWLSGALRGDLQWSSSHQEPVVKSIARALPNTVKLMGLAYCTSLLGGIALGTWQGTREGKPLQRASTAITFTMFALPDFWIAMLLQLVFVTLLGWFPSGGTSSFNPNFSTAEKFFDQLHHLALPWLALTLVDVAVFARYQRVAMRGIAGQHFLRTARAKGVPERLITWKHALRVAVLPMITIAGLYFPALLVGAIITETVFGWQGVGRLLTKAIENRDYFLVSGIVVVGSAMTAMGSILADLTREFVDPRLRA